MLIDRSCAVVLWLTSLIYILGASSSFAQSTPSPYTHGNRYNLGGDLTAEIKPSATASENKFLAVRRSYNDQGLVYRIEKGELTGWPSHEVDASKWEEKGYPFSVTQITTYEYDDWGRKTIERRESPSGAVLSLTQYSYDGLGRLECTAVRMNPTSYGSIPSSACSLGSAGLYGPDRITKTVYSENGLPRRVLKAYGTSLQQIYAEYTYYVDSASDHASSYLWEVRTVKDANGNLTRYDHDGYGRLHYWFFPHKTSKGSYSSGDYEKYSYDANQNRTSIRKRDGKIINYQYDRLNRVISKTFPASSTENVYYGYNLQGLEVYARYQGHSGPGVSRVYDGFGNVTEERNNSYGTNYTLSYQYDKHGNRERITYPDGKSISYQYDGLDRLKKILDPSGSQLISLTYDKHYRSQLRRSGASSTSYEFDAVNRLRDLHHAFPNANHQVRLEHDFNPASQIVRNDASNSRYHYVAEEKGIEGYTVNGLNQYVSIGGHSLTHDANGNLTYHDGIGYQYDTENRLVRATGAKNAYLRYDPLGRLREIDKGSSSTRTRFIYSGDSLVAEYSASGALLKRYILGPDLDQPLVEYNGTSTASSNRRYFYQNHQGSVIATSNQTGSSVSIYAYDPYGIPKEKDPPRVAYTGQMYLDEIDLYHYRARVYSPYLGRFLQTDPVGYEDQMNLYAYVHNDPLNYTDPTGEWGLAGAIYGAIAGAVGGYVASGGTLKGTLTGAVAGGAVGSVNPLASNAVGMALGGAAASAAGQAATQIADNIQAEGLSVDAVTNVEIDVGTTAGALVGGGAGGSVAKVVAGAAPKVARSVVGNTFKASNASNAPGKTVGAVIEGATVGAGETAGNAVGEVVDSCTQDGGC